MATYAEQLTLKAKAYFSIPGEAALASLSHTRGSLHKPGETNSIGLVMMGAVEFAGSRNIIPSGTNREYGYWRGEYNRTFIDNFDQAWMPLEGSGMYAGSPTVTVSTTSTGTSEDGSVSNCDAQDCIWMWSGAEWDLYATFCVTGCQCADAPTVPGGFMGDMANLPCVGGSSSSSAAGTGDDVGFAKWEKAGALNDNLGQESIQQRCLFLSDRSFVNAGSGIDLKSSLGYSVYAKVVPSGDITGTVIMAQHRENPAQFVLGCDYDGSYYIRSDHAVSGINTPVVAKTSKSFEAYRYPAQIIGVYGSGDSKLAIYVNGKKEGESAPFNRDKVRGANTNVTFGKREFAIAERGFTGWIDEAGVASRSMSGSSIEDFHDATFKITDLIFNSKVTPLSSNQATATVTITDYTELNSTDKVNLIATDGTNYDFINGDQSSVAGTWESTTSNDQTATNLMNVINTSSGPAGTRFSASVVGAVVTITQNTVGVEGNTTVTLTDTETAGMTSTNFVGGVQSGLSGKSFGDTGIDALNSNYVEFVVDSGVAGRLNPEGARGGAFDKELWGQTDYAVSSVLTFDLTEVPTRFHQLTDLSVDLWVEHTTNHPSGADVSARLVNKFGQINSTNLHWHPSGVSVPSGTKRLISITHPLEHEAYYRSGQPSFRQDFDDHQLELSVKYPKSDMPYDAEFKIYSSKLNFSGYDTLATFNTMQGLTEAGVLKGHAATDLDGNVISYSTGDKSLSMVSLGGAAALSSGIMNMFVDVGTADQALNLVLNHDLETSMGSSAKGYLFANAAIEMSGRRMNLYTAGGTFNKRITLYLQTDEYASAFSPTLPLEIAGSILSYPRSQRTSRLYLLASTGYGSPSGVMNLAMPKTKSGTFFDKRLLFVEGRQPVSDIPLYVQVSESGVKAISLYTLAPSFYNGSGIMNMFMKQKDFYGTGSMNAVPTIVGTGNMPLFMNGYAIAGSATGTQATGTVSITDFTELNSTDKVNLIAADGTNYDFTNGDQSSVAGTWESATSNDQTATNLMNVINTSSGPAGTRFSASVVGAVVTITQNTSGPDGNTAITLTDTGSAGMTKTDFAGGLEPTRTMNFAMPNVLGSGTQTTTLNIRGYL